MNAYGHELMDAAIAASEHGQTERADDLALWAKLSGYKESDELDGIPSYVPGTHEIGIKASDVEEMPLEWVWNSWFPRGYISFFVGDSKLGKSTFIRDVVARLTTGHDMPDGSASVASSVVYISYEEPAEDVLVPRLRKAGCNLERVRILSSVIRATDELGSVTESPFEVPKDIPLLEQAIIQSNASMVIIDPLMGMTQRSIARNQSARKILEALQACARRTGVAIVIINHVTKGKKKSLIEAMDGSKGLSDFARSIVGIDAYNHSATLRRIWVEAHSLCWEQGQIIAELTPNGMRYLSGEVDKTQEKVKQYSDNRHALIAMLASDPTKQWQANELAQVTRMSWDNARKTLRRMLQANECTCDTRGLYSAYVPVHDDKTVSLVSQTGINEPV